MFTSKQYRAKATEYGDLAETSAGSNQAAIFKSLSADSRRSRTMSNCSQITIKAT
jgi:hypothetical protein